MSDTLLQRLRRDARRDPLAAARLKAEEARRCPAVRCVASGGEDSHTTDGYGDGYGYGYGYGDGYGNGYGNGYGYGDGYGDGYGNGNGDGDGDGDGGMA